MAVMLCSARLWPLLGLVACASPAALCPAPPSPIVEVRPPPGPATSALASASAPAPAASAPAAEATSPCWARGTPSAPREIRTTGGHCNGMEAAELVRAEAAVRKAFVIQNKPARLFVDFGCDLAGETPEAIYLERGSGHGGSLVITRLEIEANRVSARVFDIDAYHRQATTFQTATLDPKRFTAQLASSRVAMLARPHLVQLVDRSGNLSLSSSFSTYDYHLRLSLLDRDGDSTDRVFTGYESSGEQEASLPMKLATRPLIALLEAAKPQPAEATEADRRWLTERFLFTMRGEPAWWVKERYVQAMRSFGTIDAVPALAAMAKQKGNGAEERIREAVVGVIHQLTGWDASDGGALGFEAAAARIAKECALPPGPR